MVGITMDIEKEMTQTVIVKQNEGDLNGRLKLSDLLRYVQQISTDHCTALGVGEAEYKQSHSGFLLAKTSVEVYDDMKVGDLLRIVTHPGKAIKAVYPRYTEIFNEEGKLAASVDARWILVNPESRRIYRHQPENLPLHFGNDSVPAHSSLSIPKEKEAEIVGEETIRYSRLDINHHLNNTEYADIICDWLPSEWVCEKPIHKLVIHYHHEVKLGERIQVLRKQLEEGWYLCGCLMEKKAFEAWIEF